MSMFGVRYTTPLLDDGGFSGSGGSSGDFSIANSYNPPLGGFSSGVDEPPLWKQILWGLGDLSNLLDVYIFTEQEKAWIDMQKALAEAQKARALAEAERARALAEAQNAAIAKERAQPNWLLIGGAVLVGGLLVYLLVKG